MTEQQKYSNPQEELAQTEQIGAILDTFEESPTDDAIWQEAYGLVREGESVDDGTTAASIATEDLITFADQVRATEPAERYALTTALAPDGQHWFDVLRTFSSPQLERAKLFMLQAAYEDPEYKFARALDVGTGTGKSLATLETVSDHVVGLDKNPDVLDIAAQQKADSTDLVQGDVTELPFQDESFELVASSGLEGALDKPTAVAFYHELARILAPGGIYIDGSYALNEQGSMGREMEDIQKTAKAMLADMIVDTISGKLQVTEYLDYDERQELLESLGLQESEYGVEDAEVDETTITRVRVIAKPTD